MTRYTTLAAAAILAVSSLPLAAVAQSDAEAERGDVRERRDEVADELDVLEASDAEIDAALDEIEAAIAAQQAAVAEAEEAAAEAAAREREAVAELRGARRAVAALERAIAEMAVASFVHPPTVDVVQSLEAASLSDALLQRVYLDARAHRDLDLLDLLEAAELEAGQRADELAVATAAAEAALEVARAELGGLAEQRSRQQAFAHDLQGRIDARLAEAAVLAELDAELAAQIAAEQAALIERAPPQTEDPVVPTSAQPSGPPTSTTTTSTTPPAGGGTTSTTTPQQPPSTEAPPLRTVRGITVHAAIADDVEALLAHAASDGYALSGWGYRSTEQQIALRKQNCGPTYYDIWHRPAGTCTPPTAVPGRSLHEQGRAIDFTHGGRVITSRSSPAFRWLADNAASYGLYNLPSEPWHWSTNGA